jgi:L-lactate utilization protein LutB
MLTKSGAAGGPSALCVACGEGPIRGSYFELEEGQCHSECHEAYDLERKKATATKCTFCHEVCTAAIHCPSLERTHRNAAAAISPF